MSTPIAWGTEFLVNTTTANDQTQPTIAALADGRFVVAWTDGSESGGDTSGAAVRAQLFNADGSKSGSEFLVNTAVANDQYQPAVTALADGGFVVAWAYESGVLTGEIMAQVFDVAGGKTGDDFFVNTTTDWVQSQPAIATLADGRFVVTWDDGSDVSGTGRNIRAQLFYADGTKSGAEFLVNTRTGEDQTLPTVTALDNGGFVVAWADRSGLGGDASEASIKAQLFDADGTIVGGELLVNTTTAGEQFRPSVTALADGRFVVAWEDFSATGDDTSEGAVRAQVFNADGTTFGTELLVNTITSNSQNMPTVAALADGRFVAAWVDLSNPMAWAVRAQVFDTDGMKDGGELLVNIPTAVMANRFDPVITALADGRFVLAWTEGYLSDDIHARIFDPRTAAVELFGSIDGDDYVGTIWNDSLYGGYGDDRLAAAAGSDLVDGAVGNDTLFGGYGNDRLFAGDGRDRLYGGPGSDELFGEGGNDTVDGGSGGDRLIGGAGDDSFYVDTLRDVVVEAGGGGTDAVVSSTISLDLARYANVEWALAHGTLGLSLDGNSLDNRLYGNAGANWIAGSSGNDTLHGYGGGDYLRGGPGHDSLYGDEGNDVLRGDDGNDYLIGGAGVDAASYSSAVGAVVVSLTTTASQDTGGAGRDTLWAIEDLGGSIYADRLTGNSSANTLYGVQGNDTLAGGTGQDTFRFNTTLNAITNVDSIKDFVVADDTISLENSVFARLTVEGVLAAEDFASVASSGATVSVAPTVNIIYDRGTGNLYYDVDGLGAANRTLFATLAGSPDAVSRLDFEVT